ncbi:hypothetical protein Ddye_005958 [Dipteronia dyeriana]|uniref:Uncharacterized protein n=1 Tax=Dipteronia dyeriana TaxID=168575 RepID=A0AAE0CQ40_9ROSI|nr:hypothetical protein Ddye_005958 [Dipteronia dyeriana]
MGCSEVKRIRSQCYFLKGSKWGDDTHFQDFFLFFIRILRTDELELLCVILWRVWFWRNQRNHAPIRFRLEDVLSWAFGFIEEYNCANKPVSENIHPQVNLGSKWCPPPIGVYKISKDVAISERDRVIDAGVII